MMMPNHSRLVGVAEVGGDLTEEEVQEMAREGRIYFITDYLVLLNQGGDRAAIVRVEREGMPKRTQGKGPLPSTAAGFTLIRKVTGVEVLAGPEETTVVRAPVNVMNPSELVSAASRACRESGARAAVVFGNHSHVNFVIDPPEDVPRIRVVEVVPPHPSRLLESLEVIRSSQFRDVPMEFLPFELDLVEIAERLEKEFRPSLIVFPCSGSQVPGRIGEARTAFLDKPFQVEGEEVVLIGCDISKKVFTELFPEKDFHLHNICPRNLPMDGPFIMRCCQKDRLGPLEIGGHRGYVVHWGATYQEMVEGLRYMVEEGGPQGGPSTKDIKEKSI